jgi:hypothetical protein
VVFSRVSDGLVARRDGGKVRDVVCVGRSGGCRGVTDVGVFEGGGSMRNCIGCGG